jgi:phosphatidylserine decarboxylase
MKIGYEPKNSVVKDLKDLIEKNNWEGKFEEAIQNAQKYKIERIRDIKNFDAFLEWLDTFVKWVPYDEAGERDLYYNICEFYFFLDQEPVKSLQTPEEPGVTGETPLSKWMVDFANSWGTFLNTPESTKHIDSFKKVPEFKLYECEEPPSGWKSFNQFFARRLKPGMRPIASLCDDSVIVSPADSTFVGWWQILDNSKIIVKNLEWSVLELLEGSPFKERFRGGVFTHSFLNTFDYHRYHVPVGGTVKEARQIQGLVYLDVVAKKEGDKYVLDALDGTGWQFVQARGLVVIDSPIGLVAVLPMGMAQVSSAVITAEKGKKLRKGEEFGYFLFGASDIIMLFEAACNVELTARPNQHYNMGACIGHAHVNR